MIKRAAFDFTATEIAKIVIGVACIFILILLGASLYSILIGKTNLEQAKASLDEIVIKIKNLQDGKTESFLMTAPEKWLIIFFGTENEKPKGCLWQRCLCICSEDVKLERCEYCKEAESDIEIITYRLKVEKGFFSGAIYFDELPLQLIIKKENGRFSIKVEKQEEQEKENLLIFEELLNYNFEGEKFIKIVERFVNEYGLTREKNKLLKKELDKILDDFFEEKKLEGVFYITYKQKNTMIFFYITKEIKFRVPVTREIEDTKKNKYLLFFNTIKK